jgi:two-component system response regulator HydG
VDVAIVDLLVPEIGGMALLRHIRENHPEVRTIALTQHEEAEITTESLYVGTDDYIQKPVCALDLQEKLMRWARPKRPYGEHRQLQGQLQTNVSCGGLIGTSAPIQVVQRLITRTIDRNFPVVILGESGTGKELVARSIHQSGSRKNNPFVPIDCSSIAATLFESELFGYVRGAFTGAISDRKGLFEAAHTGTLFLDEIGELPKELQAKLLRAVQEGEVRRVGATQRVSVDVRIVVATNRDLRQAVEKGTFREDLYYRLNVFPIALPPLRERRSDIPLLVTAFLNEYADPGRPITSIAEEFWTDVMAYLWPGNVRELQNFVERSIALGSGPVLRNEDQGLVLGRTNVNIEQAGAEPLCLVEKRAILKTLSGASGDKRTAARILGIGKTTLYRKLKQYQALLPGETGGKA